MTRRAMLAASMLWAMSLPALASEETYIRMLACRGPDANMEVYLPQSLTLDGPALAHALARPVIGYYALDLSEANKGKVLEPVRVSVSADGRTVIIDQYSRKLPPTRVPVAGGTVDFDRRFGAGAKCGAFQAQD